MRHLHSLLLLGALAASSLLFSTPVQAKAKVNLGYTAISAGADAGIDATVGVSFKDSREPKKGGDEPNLVGQIRGSYGIPYGVFTRSKEEAEQVVTTLGTQALGAAGIRGAAVGAGSHNLELNLTRLWGDGFGPRYEMSLEVTATLTSGGQTLWSTQISESEGVTVMGKGLKKGYERTMDAFGAALVATFASPAFKAALAPAPAAPEARPEAGGEASSREEASPPGDPAPAPAEEAEAASK